MNRRFVHALVAGSLAALALSGCGNSREAAGGVDGCDPGITDDTIKLGASTMQSGAAAAYKAMPQASLALFDEVNEAGGVTMGDGKKRKIEFVSLDDAYDPARAVKNTRQLVEKDQVFAIFQAAGTSPTLAIMDYTTKAGVPIVFAATGSDEFQKKRDEGATIAAFMLPQVGFENEVMVRSIEQIDPDATIAVLYPNDGLGKGSLAGLKDLVKDTGLKVVAEESYEQTSTSVDSQIVNLKSSGADVFVNFGTGTFVTQALKKANEIDWDVEKFVISASTDVSTVLAPAGEDAAEGVRSVAWVYDVSSDANNDMPGVENWREFAERNKDRVDTHNSIAALGYNNSQMMLKALEEFDGCTREGLLETVQKLRGVETDLGLEGITFGSGDADYPYAITSMATMQFLDGKWEYADVITRDK
ncbi:ABC-type branched-subunit amino acid transport system substrate-binding protein [Nocardioides daedukensis]|uniref:ABC-type branched-subunit amino acid transport system substrate-binding protein n=1 Tax=Nocardioides daedukensis TaxID=634462 RepID=A0A7Y9RZZ8_9ACTN|nr:ABC transporter substrate-binding protein [Nocardioides daedukensis]NYG59751.1 ABC-type branched-subunit amino acid transport system substrate-binding protein [Nocardioides daedukensis]